MQVKQITTSESGAIRHSEKGDEYIREVSQTFPGNEDCYRGDSRGTLHVSCVRKKGLWQVRFEHTPKKFCYQRGLQQTEARLEQTTTCHEAGLKENCSWTCAHTKSGFPFMSTLFANGLAVVH